MVGGSLRLDSLDLGWPQRVFDPRATDPDDDGDESEDDHSNGHMIQRRKVFVSGEPGYPTRQ